MLKGYSVYEVKNLIHCIISRGIGVELCWVPSHCGLYWNEISDKLAKQGALKNMSAISCSKLLVLLSQHEIYSIHEQAMYKDLDKNEPAILSCPRYLARVIYKILLEHRFFTEGDMYLC